MSERVERQPPITLAFAGGVSAIVCYIAGSLAAWKFYPRSFSPVTSWLSQLGDYSRNPNGAVFYNAGCIATATALLMFMAGLSSLRTKNRQTDRLLTASQLAGLLSVFCLIMLAVYSEDQLRRHMVYSNGFFSLFPLFVILLSSALITHPQIPRTVGMVGFGVVLVGIAFHLVYPVSRPLEWFTEAGFLSFVGLVAWSARTRRPRQLGPESPGRSRAR
jgi:uncharacterized protein DUF998